MGEGGGEGEGREGRRKRGGGEGGGEGEGREGRRSGGGEGGREEERGREGRRRVQNNRWPLAIFRAFL